MKDRSKADEVISGIMGNDSSVRKRNDKENVMAVIIDEVDIIDDVQESYSGVCLCSNTR